MRLRTQLIAATLLFTFALTVVLSLVFLSELLRERIAQTASANDVLVHQMLASMGSSLRTGLKDHPPTEPGQAAFDEAVKNTLSNDESLNAMLNGFVSYSPTLQDAYIVDAHGIILTGTDPKSIGQPQPTRRQFSDASGDSLLSKRHLLFGAPEVLDVHLPLDRNGQPFLVAHLGIRSTLLRNAYAPWLRDATLVCIFALGGSLLVAAAISAAALRPIERISRELDVISARGGVVEETATEPESSERDAVERVSSKISRLDEQIRSTEQNRSEMATNLNSMLQTLKDGVMLFTPELRVAMASDAVANFLPEGISATPGAHLTDVFSGNTAIGAVLAGLIAQKRRVRNR